MNCLTKPSVFWATGLLVVGGHVWALSALSEVGQAGGAPQAGGAAAVQTRSIERVLPAPAPVDVPPSDVVAQTEPAVPRLTETAEPRETAPRETPVAEAPPREREERPAPEIARAPLGGTVDVLHEAASPADALVPPAEAQPDSPVWAPYDYIPRRLLTVPPRPRATVVLAYPESEQVPGEVLFVMSLYIGEDGRVRRAELDEGSPPAVFAQTARDAFEQAEFEPGFLDGRAVRSLVRVEVRFIGGR